MTRPSLLPLVVVLACAGSGAALSWSPPEALAVVRALPAVKRVLVKQVEAELPWAQALEASRGLARVAVKLDRARVRVERLLEQETRPGCAAPEWQAPVQVPVLDRVLRTLGERR